MGVIVSNGGVLFIGKPVLSGTSGSILFIDSSGNIAQDNSELFWDNTNNRLGIGTTAPLARLEIETDSSTEVGIIIMGAASQSADLAQFVDSAGVEKLAINATGHLRFWEGQTETTSITSTLISSAGTLTMNNSGSSVIGFKYSTEQIHTVIPGFGLFGLFFQYIPRIVIQAASAVVSAPVVYANQYTMRADGVACTAVNAAGSTFEDGPVWDVVNSGTWGSGSVYTSFRSGFTVTGAGTTWGTRTAFRVNNGTGTGSITTQIGLDIQDLTKATTNIYLRALGTGSASKYSIHQPWLRIGGSSAPALELDITGAFATSKATVSLTADNQTVTTANRSYISLSSDNGTAGNRTFILAQSTVDGHRLVIEWTGTNAGELIDDSAQGTAGNHRMSANWTPTQYDTISFISNGTDWIETGRSTN